MNDKNIRIIEAKRQIFITRQHTTNKNSPSYLLDMVFQINKHTHTHTNERQTRTRLLAEEEKGVKLSE